MKLQHKINKNTIAGSQEFLDNHSEYQEYIPEIIVKTLDELRLIKIKEVHSKYKEIISNALELYSELEKSTFQSQEDEWIRWNTDNTISTTIIDVLATARGIDRLVLLDKIGNNVLSRITLVGEQQAKEDEINACTTETEINNITI